MPTQTLTKLEQLIIELICTAVAAWLAVVLFHNLFRQIPPMFLTVIGFVSFGILGFRSFMKYHTSKLID
jgi:hypothetical protein